jgi:MFS family permease
MAREQAGSARQEWKRHWPLVLAGTSGMSLASLSTSSFGVMLVPLEQALGWSRSQISLGPLVLTVTVILVGTLMGYAVDKLGSRIVALFCAVLLCGAIAAMSLLTANPLWWLLIWVVIGIASAAMPTVSVTPVSKGFFAGRGLALAAVFSGSGISAFLVPNVANWLVEHYQWRNAYLGLAALWAAIVIPIFLLFLRDPKIAPVAADPAIEAAAATVLPGMSAGEGFRSLAFYKLFFANMLTVVASVGLILNMVPVLRSTGISAGTAAWIYGFSGIATIVGRVFAGWLMDRFNASMVVGLCVIGLVALPGLLLLVPGSVPLAMAAVIAAGLLGGSTTPANAYLAGKHFGPRNFGTFYSTINVASSIGVGLGPLIANLVYDQTKSYELVMWGSIPALVLAGLLYLWLGQYPDFDRQAEAAAAAALPA